MKNENHRNEQKCSPIDVRYLLNLFDKLKTYETLYYLLLSQSTLAFSVQQLYDYTAKLRAKSKRGCTEPLRIFSLQEFLVNAETFHEKDKFAISLANGICIVDNQLEADTLLALLEFKVAKDTRLIECYNMVSDTMYNPEEVFAYKFDFITKDILILKRILCANSSEPETAIVQEGENRSIKELISEILMALCELGRGKKYNVSVDWAGYVDSMFIKIIPKKVVDPDRDIVFCAIIYYNSIENALTGEELNFSDFMEYIKTLINEN